MDSNCGIRSNNMLFDCFVVWKKKQLFLLTEDSSKPGEVARYAGANDCFKMFLRGFGNVEAADILSDAIYSKELCMHECVVRDACVGFTFRMTNDEPTTYALTNYKSSWKSDKLLY